MFYFIIFTLLINTLAIITLTLDQQYQESNAFFKLTQSQYQVIQSIRNATFFFQPTQIDQDKYISVELIFGYPQDGNVNVEFSITKNKDDNTSSLNNVFYDMNGKYLQKAYQMILINPYTFSKNDQFYIDVNIRDTNFTDYQYLIKITRTQNKICPNFCGNQQSGSCNTKIGICACSSEFADLDCSKQAKSLLLQQPLKNLTIHKQEYFYFERDQSISNITLSLDLMNPLQKNSDTQVFIMYENFEIGLPNENFFDYSISLFNSTSQSQEIDLNTLIYDLNIERFQRLLITVKTKSSDLIQLSINISNVDDNFSIDSSLLIVYVLVSIAIILILAWIIIIIIRYKRSSRIHQISNSILNPQNDNNRSNYFTKNKKLFDEYMPKLLYLQILEIPQFLESEVQETCSVCLLEYQKDAICRFTPCNHIFHSDCLEQWIMKNENCPLCRCALDLKTLLELKSQNANIDNNSQQQKKKQKKYVVIQSQLFSNAQTELRMIAPNSMVNQ
ncbi:unnamed protein product [Paramecium sonneborni]|uniref:RING-type domain-containing protein n=1 Tax=Paramecium sonneborni TaxID=65129 RepID=A0A8S1PDE5_9CILI|nr:unnamed protein product [Paramecium sonneborni]